MESKDPGLPIGTILLDRYRIERKIGAGGMSHIYLSSDQWREQTFAVIKTPFLNLLHDKWVIKKFKQEAESLARLDHDGIVRLLGHGSYEQQFPFVILEYVEGVTLTSLVEILPADFERVARIFLQITEAVEHIHSHNIFHRDLKPDNIMVQNAGTENETIKLIDFGIARLDKSFFMTSPNTRHQVGTPHYIAPNRLRLDPDDRADDIYSLGLIAYEMTTGTNPLRAATDWDALLRIQENVSPPRRLNPNLPKAANREIVRALSLNQINRHSTAIEFGKNLHEALLFNERRDKTQILPAMPEEDQVSTADLIISEELEPEQIPDETKLLSAISPGEDFLLSGKFEAAIGFYDEKIQAENRSDLFYSRRAMAFLMKKDYENAVQDCQNALKIYPENDFAHLIRGIIYRLKLWSAEAEASLLKAISINQKNIEAALVLGDIYASRRNVEKALSYYSHVCRINPRFSWVYTNRGNLYYNQKNYEAAIADFTLAINTNPMLAWNYYQRAKSRAKSGQSAGAVEDLTEAIALNPKNTTCYNERAKLYFNLGRTKEALSDFNRVKELCARDSFVADDQEILDKDKKAGLASLVDYLKWILSGQPGA